MKKPIPYQHFSNFVMRSPLFSFTFIQSIISDRQIDGEKLKEICRNPVIQEALFLASPDLYNQMKEWLQGNLDDPKKIRRLHYGIMRYILRMSTRPTPFGLFAGFNIGSWEDETRVELPPQGDYARHTRMDMNYLCALALDLARHPVIKARIKYYPNSSIYPVGDQLRYVEYRYLKARRTHHIVAVDHSPYLQKVLDKAEAGAYLEELARLLVDDEITFEEAAEFIEELVESQLLVHDLEPAITGPEFLEQILAILDNIDGIDDIKARVESTKEAIEKLDAAPIGSTIPNYYQIIDNLKPLGTEFELKYMFQTDMVKPVTHCTLDKELVEDVVAGIEVMNRLSSPPGATTLSQFRDAFMERYETREIPLLHALDTECGLGYRQSGSQGDISPLIDDLVLPATGGDGSDVRWNRVQAFLHKKYREALEQGAYEVELTDKDLEPFEPRWDDLPDTFSLMTTVVEGKKNGSPKEKIFMSGFGGSSAGNLLGRFCHADEKTFDFVKEISAREAELNPNVILAEIIHLPEARLGNILLRPVLRDYEIPYLGKPAVDEEHRIDLSDLLVSVRGNRVVLRSKRLNKEIVPHLTSAHNYSMRALPIYHFLADLQTQNIRGGAGFSWGALAGEYEFLPRVVYKNIIFNPATWAIKKEEIEPLLKIKDDNQLAEAVLAWREKKRIPAYVAQVDADNKLFIDLDNPLCVRTLFSVVKNRPNFQLVEFLFDPDNAVVESEDGVFTNEFVLSFYKTPREENEKHKNGNTSKNT